MPEKIAALGPSATIQAHKIGRTCRVHGKVSERTSCRCGVYTFKYSCDHKVEPYPFQCGQSRNDDGFFIFCDEPGQVYEVDQPKLSKKCAECAAEEGNDAEDGHKPAENNDEVKDKKKKKKSKKKTKTKTKTKCEAKDDTDDDTETITDDANDNIIDNIIDNIDGDTGVDTVIYNITGGNFARVVAVNPGPGLQVAGHFRNQLLNLVFGRSN